jgi:uncharacterized repeat protein (TIGR01451 family)
MILCINLVYGRELVLVQPVAAICPYAVHITVGRQITVKLVPTIKRNLRKLVVTAVVTATAVAGFGLYQHNVNAANLTLNTSKDCDSNAVVYCGATSLSTLQSKYKNGDTKNSAKSIANIYYSFGIGSSDVSDMSDTAVTGYVTKSGNVYAGGQLVATGAMTAGRLNIPGSTKTSYGGTTFYKRAPSVSFVGSSIPAYVSMKDGVFQFAILGPCGNPVTGKPKTPNYTIQKDVRVKGDSTWANDVSVKPGTHVEYRVTVKSTGAIAAKNIVVKDQLPQNVSYVDGTLQRDGAAANSSDFFGTKGNTITSLATGKSVTYTFEAIADKDATVYTCKEQTLTNTGKMSAPGLPSKCDTADVNEKCAPKPAYSCDALTADQTARTAFNFTAKASASNGATIAGYTYDFGDGNNKTNNTTSGTDTTSHTYDKAGTYNVTVTALIKADGDKQATSEKCKTTVKVNEAPSAACTDLTLTKSDSRNVTAKVTYTTSGGATLKNVSYDFGDSTAIVNSTSTTATHQFAQDGSYTVKATLSFNGSETVADQHCQANITIVTPAYSCDAFAVTQGDSRTVTVSNFHTTATGGATFNNVSIKWGDGTPDTTVAGNPVGQTHQYTSDGAFGIVAVATFTVDGQVVTASSENCMGHASFETQPVCKYNPQLPPDSPECKPPQNPCTYNPNLPANSPECKKKEVCKYNPNLPVDSKDCKQPCQYDHSIPADSMKCQPAPTVLPNTGAGSMLGIFAGVSLAGAAAYRFFIGRKLSRES